MTTLTTKVKGTVKRSSPNRDPVPPSQPSQGLFDITELKTGDRSHLEDRCRAAARYAALEPHCGLARVLGRYKMFVNPKDDAVSAHLILDGYWEMWNTIFLSRFVKPGMKIVEVGSNLGYFSLLMSDLAGPSGRVHGFEPLTYNAELLERTIAINGFHGRFSVDRRAASDSEGFAHIYVPVGNWGGGSIVVGENSFHTATHEEVETIRLDAFCEANDLSPDFIKMDAEGSERAIWKGMSRLLGRQHRIAVMLEFDHHRIPGWRDWFAELEREKFKLFRVGYDARLSRIRPGDPDPQDMFEVLALRGYSERTERALETGGADGG